MNSTPTYSVPRLLWESLEDTFNNEARRYIKDLAQCLHVPADTLIAKILPKKSTVKVYLQDSPADMEDLACRAFIAAGTIAARCRSPVTLGTTFCCRHQYYRPEVNTSIEGVRRLSRLALPSNEKMDYPEMWYDDAGTVYDCEMMIRGHYISTTGILQLFNSTV